MLFVKEKYVNAFFYSALICTSIVLEACWLFWGLRHTQELLPVAFKPRAGVCMLWGMCSAAPFKRRKLSSVCFGMLAGNTVLMAKCRGMVGAQRASAGVLSEGACWSDKRYAFFPFFCIPKSPSLLGSPVGGLNLCSLQASVPPKCLLLSPYPDWVFKSHWESLVFICMDALVR